jgi:hypothetical protein
MFLYLMIFAMLQRWVCIYEGGWGAGDDFWGETISGRKSNSSHAFTNILVQIVFLLMIESRLTQHNTTHKQGLSAGRSCAVVGRSSTHSSQIWAVDTIATGHRATTTSKVRVWGGWGLREERAGCARARHH